VSGLWSIATWANGTLPFTKRSVNDYASRCTKARIRLEIKIEIELKFNQSEERKLISELVNFALIGQIQSNLNLNL